MTARGCVHWLYTIGEYVPLRNSDESFGGNGFHKMPHRPGSALHPTQSPETNEAGLPRSHFCLHWITDGAHSNQTMHYREREPDWFNIHTLNWTFHKFIVTRTPFPVTSEINVFFFTSIWKNASRNSLPLYLRCLLMVLVIKYAIMYLKTRSSFTITKKRTNTPNVPEVDGMTHSLLLIILTCIDLMHWRHVSITTTPCWGSRLVALRSTCLAGRAHWNLLTLSVSVRTRASSAYEACRN